MTTFVKNLNAMSTKLFASKIGLVAATVGSAVGLGNIWRFPAEAQEGGGAAFLIVYIGCIILLGIPVMLSEFALGRAGRSDAIGSLRNTGAGKSWQAVGAWAILASYLILCFYMVVSGWALEYFYQSITGSLFPIGNSNIDLGVHYTNKMNELISDSYNPLIGTFIVIALNIVILLGGVQKGIERLSNIAMPMLFVILVILVGVSLSLPGAMDGVSFFLKPDFSKVTPLTIINATGQAFFSLSLGMGVLITYASYFPKNTKLTRTALTVSMLDLSVSVMMGLIIFPAVTSFGLAGEGLRGATLVFVTLPEVFASMPATQLWSILFFLLLAIAAITSTVSIAEVSIAFICEHFNVKRWKSALIVLVPLFVFSSICSLSMGPWSDIKIAGLNIFDLLDTVATNIMLPIGSIFLCIYMGWRAPRKLFIEQLSNGGELKSAFYSIAIFIVRYVAPILIAIMLISTFI